MDKLELNERLAVNVKRMRKKKRIPLREFDGITYQCIWKIENPKEDANPSFYAVWKIAEKLDCTIEELISVNNTQ